MSLTDPRITIFDALRNAGSLEEVRAPLSRRHIIRMIIGLGLAYLVILSVLIGLR